MFVTTRAQVLEDLVLEPAHLACVKHLRDRAVMLAVSGLQEVTDIMDSDLLVRTFHLPMPLQLHLVVVIERA